VKATKAQAANAASSTIQDWHGSKVSGGSSHSGRLCRWPYKLLLRLRLLLLSKLLLSQPGRLHGVVLKRRRSDAAPACCHGGSCHLESFPALAGLCCCFEALIDLVDSCGRLHGSGVEVQYCQEAECVWIQQGEASHPHQGICHLSNSLQEEAVEQGCASVMLISGQGWLEGLTRQKAAATAAGRQGWMM
jgi:hypothetical protein